MGTPSRPGVLRPGAMRLGSTSAIVVLPSLAPTQYRLLIRAANRQLVAELDQYMKLELTLRFNAPGSWQCTYPATSAAGLLLDWGGGLIVERNGSVLCSGPLRSRNRIWDGTQDVIEASGPDDLTWVAERWASPDPTLSGPPYDTQTNDVRTGFAESVIHARGSTVTGRALAPA
jgi:hypothetical protein